MIVELNYILLDNIFSQASNNKEIINSKKIKEEDLIKDNTVQNIYIEDDIRIYKKDDILYIFIDDATVTDTIFNIFKDTEIFKNVNGIILSYKDTIKYNTDEIKLQKLIKQITKDANLFMLKLARLYEKEISNDLTKVAIIGQINNKNIENNQDIIDNIINGINIIKQNIYKFGSEFKDKFTNLVKRTFLQIKK